MNIAVVIMLVLLASQYMKPSGTSGTLPPNENGGGGWGSNCSKLPSRIAGLRLKYSSYEDFRTQAMEKSFFSLERIIYNTYVWEYGNCLGYDAW